jgi:hypothetical protein
MNLRLIRCVSRHITEPRRVVICHGRVRTHADREVAQLRWSARPCVRSRQRTGCWGVPGLERFLDD